MDYIGEHLLPGKLGHFFILLSFFASLASSYFYFKATRFDDPILFRHNVFAGFVNWVKGWTKAIIYLVMAVLLHRLHVRVFSFQSVPLQWTFQTLFEALLPLVILFLVYLLFFSSNSSKGNSENSLYWKKLARIFFITEAISILAIFTILFYIISHHLFEYKYAWQHSSLSLEMKYLLSCFWEGQEGSFLLWSFWHCVLGLVVIKTAKQWEAPVMTVVSFAQVFLATMLVGITVFGLHVGANPFLLLRIGVQAPIFSRPEYLSLVKDGNDLNPLLQNYWMTIHPPVLFLGFASTLIPFSYAVAGLWTKDYKGWTKHALNWSLFSAAVLGTGIMMGAAWAYESLNFGGYWAWDPVENASLVPWLVMVSGVHAMLIYRHTGNALRSSFLFYILSFLLILYSTYLTRSGDLQDTSVHAFTGEGITKWHLRLLVLAFTIPSLGLFIRRYKKIPFIAKEEEASSREFWMFIGSLVLLLSATTILAMTSLPVINKIIGVFVSNKSVFKPLAIGEDSAFAYNRIQVFVAIILGLLTAVTQYFKYKHTSSKLLIKKLLIPTAIALVIAALVIGFGNINYREYGYGYLGAVWFALLCSIYAVVANASYIWIGMNGKLRAAGGSVAHLGFGLLLTGILVSSSKKEVLSYNTSGIFVPLGKDSKEKAGENLTLVKDLRTSMGPYWVTYNADSAHPKKPLWFYSLKFESKDGKENFTLQPNAFVNYKGNQGLMANPDAKHYWNYDVFTYITSLSADPGKKPEDDTASFRAKILAVNDTAFYSSGYMILTSLKSSDHIPQPGFAPTDSATLAEVIVHTKNLTVDTVRLLMVKKGGEIAPVETSAKQESLVLRLQGFSNGKAELGIKESSIPKEYITLKAYKFPFINLVWLGTIVMVIGIIMALIRRIQLGRNKLVLTKEATARKKEVVED